MNFTVGKALARGGTRAVERAAAPRAPRPVDGDGHPVWCARGHHCTARRSGMVGPMTLGEHASEPETWDTAHGRVVATRHRTARTGADWVEIRTIVPLPSDDDSAERLTRHLIGVGHLVLTRVCAGQSNSDKQKGHLR
jgi:hypothetical protein